MKRAAAKLGLAFIEKISIGGSRSISRRRSLSSLAAASEDVVVQPGSEKSVVYLCFVENSVFGDEHYLNQIVRPIKLKLITDDDRKKDKEKLLPVVADYQSPSTVNTGWSLSIRFGSKLVFPTGIRFGHITHFSYIDTDTAAAKSSPTTRSVFFSTPKYNPQLVELIGKIYCIDSCPYSDDDFHPFEVLSENLMTWRPLDPPPPFISGSNTYNHFDVSVLEGSNKIICWERGKVGVYCFDTEIGWKDTFSDLSSTLPFLDYVRPPIFIRDHHPILGTFHLMFIYDPLSLHITPFFMSDSNKCFDENEPLQLPPLCCDYNDYSEYAGRPLEFDLEKRPLPLPSSDFEFVHLGDQKVCLVLHRFFPHQSSQSGILLLITFKYEIITTIINSKPTVQIQTRLLGTRRFRYHPREVRKTVYYPVLIEPMIESVRLTGVFLL